jgi:hypothetical protein
MEREEKEPTNGQPTHAAHPAKDESTPDTTDITPGSTGPDTARLDTNTTKDTAADDYVTGLRLAALLAAITMAAFLMILDLSVVVTVRLWCSFGDVLSFVLLLILDADHWADGLLLQAIPKITTHFHSTADIGWYGSAYLLAK